MAPNAGNGSGAFARVVLPKRFCNLDRLLFALERRGLDGIVATLPYNVFYMSGFNGVAHKADEPRPYAILLSRHAPRHPILVVADYYVVTFLMQPTLGRGHPAVPGRDDAARSAAEHHGHRSLHTTCPRRRGVGAQGAKQLCLRYGKCDASSLK